MIKIMVHFLYAKTKNDTNLQKMIMNNLYIYYIIILIKNKKSGGRFYETKKTFSSVVNGFNSCK